MVIVLKGIKYGTMALLCRGYVYVTPVPTYHWRDMPDGLHSSTMNTSRG